VSFAGVTRSYLLAAALFLALTTLNGAAAAQERACMVQGKGTLADVVVSPVGAPSFTVKLQSHPFTIIPSPSLQRRSRVIVGAPLSFLGQVHQHEFTVAKSMRVAEGMIHFQAGAVLPYARGGSGKAIGMLHLDNNVKIHGVAVPCDSLTLDEEAIMAFAAMPLETEEPPSTDTLWTPREHALLLRARPGAGRALWITARDREVAMLNEIESSGGWRRVRLEGTRWSVTGWASRYDLQELTGLVGGSIGDSFSSGSGCGAGGGTGAAFVGLAPIRAGAPVFAAPGRGPWASVTALELGVIYFSGEPWVRITSAPGITEECSLNHAFLRVEDVKLPENTR
jgi:hypothetical protein